MGLRGLAGPRGLLGLFGLMACLAPGWGAVIAGEAVMAGEAVSAAPEVPLQFITLTGEIATPEAEISSMVWYGDVLVIVPQHSEKILNDGSLYFYAIDRAHHIEQAVAVFVFGAGRREHIAVSMDPRDASVVRCIKRRQHCTQ